MNPVRDVALVIIDMLPEGASEGAQAAAVMGSIILCGAAVLAVCGLTVALWEKFWGEQR